MRKYLIFIFALLLHNIVTGQSEFTEYKVKSGKHDFVPNRIKFDNKNNHVLYSVKFTEQSKYVLNGEDQYDWNKGAGWSNNLLTNGKNAAMWAWRWNPVVDSFELTGYFHKDGKLL